MAKHCKTKSKCKDIEILAESGYKTCHWQPNGPTWQDGEDYCSESNTHEFDCGLLPAHDPADEEGNLEVNCLPIPINNLIKNSYTNHETALASNAQTIYNRYEGNSDARAEKIRTAAQGVINHPADAEKKRVLSLCAKDIKDTWQADWEAEVRIAAEELYNIQSHLWDHAQIPTGPGSDPDPDPDPMPPQGRGRSDAKQITININL